MLQPANIARKYLSTACEKYNRNNPNADKQELTYQT